MSYMVGNPKDWFSHDGAISVFIISFAQLEMVIKATAHIDTKPLNLMDMYSS